MAQDPPNALCALRETRESIIARLSDAFAHDELALEEFERRLGLAHRSESVAELEQLVTDLIAAGPGVASAPSTALAPGYVRDRQSLVAILAGTMRKGPWTPPKKLRVVAVLGGAELDFRQAMLAPGVTEVRITAVLGGVSIIVPPHLAVEMDGIAILGGFAHSERAPVQPDPERPVLRVYGLAVLGGVEIKTRLPGESTHDHAHDHGRRRRALPAGGRVALPPHKE